MLRLPRLACRPILTHGGIKGFSTQKLTWGSAVGIPFNVGVWTGPDGSSILAALNPGGYGNQVNEDLSRSDQWLKRINEDGQGSGVYADFKYYGIGDRGGAAKDSTVEWIERALVSGGPVRVISAPADQLFKDITPALAAKLPTYQGELELVQHSDGALSSEAYMKRWNRKNEQLAQAAEGAATAASWLQCFPVSLMIRFIVGGTSCSARRCMTSCPVPASRRPTNTPGMTRCSRSISLPAVAERCIGGRCSPLLDTRVRTGRARRGVQPAVPSSAKTPWRRRSRSPAPSAAGDHRV